MIIPTYLFTMRNFGKYAGLAAPMNMFRTILTRLCILLPISVNILQILNNLVVVYVQIWRDLPAVHLNYFDPKCYPA